MMWENKLWYLEKNYVFFFKKDQMVELCSITYIMHKRRKAIGSFLKTKKVALSIQHESKYILTFNYS